jgi:hypothetical protein
VVDLGDKVKDTVTGFVGIVTCRHEYLNGCDRFNVQPPVDDKGVVPAEEVFDGPQLTVVKKHVVKRGPVDVGGPSKSSDVRPKEKGTKS